MHSSFIGLYMRIHWRVQGSSLGCAGKVNQPAAGSRSREEQEQWGGYNRAQGLGGRAQDSGFGLSSPGFGLSSPGIGAWAVEPRIWAVEPKAQVAGHAFSIELQALSSICH